MKQGQAHESSFAAALNGQLHGVVHILSGGAWGTDASATAAVRAYARSKGRYAQHLKAVAGEQVREEERLQREEEERKLKAAQVEFRKNEIETLTEESTAGRRRRERRRRRQRIRRSPVLSA